MQITIYNNGSDNRAVTKTLTTIKTFNASIYDNCSVLDPALLCDYDADLFTANYFYIPVFNRYYYIKNIEAVNGRQIIITGHVDVLMSYAAQIKGLTVIIDKNTGTDQTTQYLNDGSYVMQAKKFTEAVNFPSGFNDTGSYILITAGG